MKKIYLFDVIVFIGLASILLVISFSIWDENFNYKVDKYGKQYKLKYKCINGHEETKLESHLVPMGKCLGTRQSYVKHFKCDSGYFDTVYKNK